MSCPICGSDAAFKFSSTFKKIAKCSSPECGHLFALGGNPRTGEHYQPNDVWSDFRERNRELIRRLMRHGVLCSGAKVLDFGAASGHIAQAVLEIIPGASVFCVEPVREYAATFKALGLPFAETLATVTETFDSALMIEVIEHLDYPVAILKELRARMRPGGTLFLSTPCGEANFGNRKLTAYDTSEHVQFFTDKSLRLALAKAGFGRFLYVAGNEMMPKGRGAGRIVARIKDVLRPIRNLFFGRYHLVGYAKAV